MFSPDAKLFLEDPFANRQPPNDFGVLFLLRRDIFKCMGINPNTGDPIGYEAIWPGAIAILAGIDLLGKFYAGEDKISESGPRFKNYIDKCFSGVSTNDKDIIYQLRNSLMHSFGLYAKSKNGSVYRFTLGHVNSFIVFTPPDKYSIDIKKLHVKFEDSISQYCTYLAADIKLQNNFNLIYPNYGKIRIG